jgi:hypothetical protein
MNEQHISTPFTPFRKSIFVGAFEPCSHAALACRGFSEEIAHLIPVSKGSFFHRHIHWWNKGFV